MFTRDQVFHGPGPGSESRVGGPGFRSSPTNGCFNECSLVQLKKYMVIKEK